MLAKGESSEQKKGRGKSDGIYHLGGAGGRKGGDRH